MEGEHYALESHPAQHSRGIVAAMLERSINRRPLRAVPSRDRCRPARLPVQPIAVAEQGRIFWIVAREHDQCAAALIIVLSRNRGIVSIPTVYSI